MKYYAIADLHGRFDLLTKAISKIESHANGDYEIITLGDYVDRGPQSMEIIQYLIDHPEIVALQGNHEAMMLQTITEPLQPSWWIGNGGNKTLQSYGWGGPPYSIHSYDVVPKAHIEFIRDLQLYVETEKQVFVHAGIPQFNMNLPPSAKQAHKQARLEKEMQWMLYSKADSGGWKGKHVVHGHHQHEDGPHVFHGNKGGRTALDTWAYHTGRLVIGVFDDSRGPPVDFIEVKDA